MDTLGTLALWLAAIIGAWAVVATRVGRHGDARLIESGARALHAVAALLAFALAAAYLDLRAAAVAATGATLPLTLVREAWSDSPMRVLIWATAAALFAAVVPRAVRPGTMSERTRAHLVAGVVATAASLAAVALRALLPAGEEGVHAAPEMHHWAGIASRTLYVLGAAAAVVPVAVGPVPRLTTLRLRWTLCALAALVAALAFGAWARYAGITAAPELDPDGVLVDPAWSTAHLLVLVPPLILAASSYALRARQRAGDRGARAPLAAVLLLIAAAIGLVVVGPAVLDWVAGREIEAGADMLRLRGALAVGVAVALTLLAAATAVAGARAPSRDSRLLYGAQVSALLLLGAAVAALSTTGQRFELDPGASATVRAGGAAWRFTSQGTSQVEGADYDAALVAFELTSRNREAFALAGERLYRDAHGHPGARVAVPGVVRGLAADLRFTVRGLRGDRALVRAQHHPLVTPAWGLAAITIALLVAAAASIRPVPPARESA